MRFPLGDLPKDETRELARKFGLEVAEKSDSQDICFVPTGRYTQVIERLRPGAAEPGEIVHMDGRVLGKHSGIINFTIGQRRGIGIAASEPLYVVKLDGQARQVVVGPREALRAKEIVLRDVNWLGAVPFEIAAAEGVPVLARIRSTGPLQPATLRFESGVALVHLVDGEEGVSPGQACVFYDAVSGGERLLGGGWIARAGCATESAFDGRLDNAFKTEAKKPMAASPLPKETFLAGSR